MCSLVATVTAWARWVHRLIEASLIAPPSASHAIHAVSPDICEHVSYVTVARKAADGMMTACRTRAHDLLSAYNYI